MSLHKISAKDRILLMMEQKKKTALEQIEGIKKQAEQNKESLIQEVQQDANVKIGNTTYQYVYFIFNNIIHKIDHTGEISPFTKTNISTADAAILNTYKQAMDAYNQASKTYKAYLIEEVEEIIRNPINPSQSRTVKTYKRVPNPVPPPQRPPVPKATVREHNAAVSDIVVDTASNRLYWGRWAAPFKVFSMNIDSEQVTDLYPADEPVTSVICDPVFNHIYWIEGNQAIMRGSMDGSASKTQWLDISAPDKGGLWQMEIDRINRRLYWTNDISIWRVDLDDIRQGPPTTSTIMVISPQESPFPIDLAVDGKNGYLYWIDQELKKIRSSDLDGVRIWDLYDLERASRGLKTNPIAHHLYWSDVRKNTHALVRGDTQNPVIRLDGIDDYIEFPIDLSSTFTIELTVTIEQTGSQEIFSLIDDGTPVLKITCDGSNFLVFGDMNMGGNGLVIGPQVLGKVHIALVVNAEGRTNVTPYLNGFVGTATSSDMQIQSNWFARTAWLGKSIGGGGTSYFDGGFHELRIWQELRTAAQIYNHRFDILPKETENLSGYWRAEDRIGQRIPQLSRYSYSTHYATIVQPGSTLKNILPAFKVDGNHCIKIDSSDLASVDLSTGFYLETWIYELASGGNNLAELFSVEYPFADTGILSIRISNRDLLWEKTGDFPVMYTENTFYGRFGGSELDDGPNNFNLIEPGKWVHLAINFRPTEENGQIQSATIELYKNGLMQGGGSTSALPPPSGIPQIKIGSLDAIQMVIDPQTYAGTIEPAVQEGNGFLMSNLRLWNKALKNEFGSDFVSQEEQALRDNLFATTYEELVDPEQLIGYWPLQEGENEFIQDLSPNHLNGRVVSDESLGEKILQETERLYELEQEKKDQEQEKKRITSIESRIQILESEQEEKQKEQFEVTEILEELEQKIEEQTNISLNGVDEYITFPIDGATGYNLGIQFTLELCITVEDSDPKDILHAIDMDEISFKITCDGSNFLFFYSEGYMGRGNMDGEGIIIGPQSSGQVHIAILQTTADHMPKKVWTCFNGVQTAEISINNDLSFQHLLIGKTIESESASFFQGDFHELRLWEGLRTITQIYEHRFDRLSGKEDGLVALWSAVNRIGQRIPEPSGRLTSFATIHQADLALKSDYSAFKVDGTYSIYSNPQEDFVPDLAEGFFVEFWVYQLEGEDPNPAEWFSFSYQYDDERWEYMNVWINNTSIGFYVSGEFISHVVPTEMPHPGSTKGEWVHIGISVRPSEEEAGYSEFIFSRNGQIQDGGNAILSLPTPLGEFYFRIGDTYSVRSVDYSTGTPRLVYHLYAGPGYLLSNLRLWARSLGAYNAEQSGRRIGRSSQQQALLENLFTGSYEELKQAEGLIGYWPLDELPQKTEGDVLLRDLSPNNLTGQIHLQSEYPAYETTEHLMIDPIRQAVRRKYAASKEKAGILEAITQLEERLEKKLTELAEMEQAHTGIGPHPQQDRIDLLKEEIQALRYRRECPSADAEEGKCSIEQSLTYQESMINELIRGYEQSIEQANQERSILELKRQKLSEESRAIETHIDREKQSRGTKTLAEIESEINDLQIAIEALEESIRNDRDLISKPLGDVWEETELPVEEVVKGPPVVETLMELPGMDGLALVSVEAYLNAKRKIAHDHLLKTKQKKAAEMAQAERKASKRRKEAEAYKARKQQEADQKRSQGIANAKEMRRKAKQEQKAAEKAKATQIASAEREKQAKLLASNQKASQKRQAAINDKQQRIAKAQEKKDAAQRELNDAKSEKRKVIG